MNNDLLFQCGNLALLQSIVTHIPTGFFVCDLDHTVLYINEVYAGYFGKQPHDIIGKKITDIIPDSALPEVIRSGRAVYGVVRQIQNGLKSINIIVNRIPLFDDGGNIIGAMAMALIDTPEQLHNLMSQMDKFDLCYPKKNKSPQPALKANYSINCILGESHIMNSVKQYLLKYAQTDAAVLILGETGTGKELTASAIHMASPRAQGPYVAINCSAFPRDLFESELFGYSAGAFSGASKDGKSGLIKLANNGTLFLDEIGELPLDLQTKLLRVLEEKQLRPIGSDHSIEVDFRLVSATNKDIKSMVGDGTFREDLFYRINSLTLHLPSLCERSDDIPILMDSILKQLCEAPIRYDAEVIELFKQWSWPGNIRELRNVLVRAVSLCQDFSIEMSDLPYEMLQSDQISKKGLLSKAVQNSEAKIISQALDVHEWNVQKTAKSLGISRANLYEKMKKFQITRPAK